MQQITTDPSNFSGANSDGFDYGDYEGADAAGGVFYPAWTDNRAAHGGDAELYMLTPPANPSPPPPPPPPAQTGGDNAPPDTRIDRQPKDRTKKKQATFEFSADEPATFECTLDGKQQFKPCTSPLTVTVKKGRHSFEVRATDAAGNADPTPAFDSWKVKKKKKK
jgi:hypothetical protein